MIIRRKKLRKSLDQNLAFYAAVYSVRLDSGVYPVMVEMVVDGSQVDINDVGVIRDAFRELGEKAVRRVDELTGGGR